MTRFGACKTTASAEDTAQLFIDMIVKLHGCTLVLTTDRGPEFTNRFVAHMLTVLGTEHCKTTSYHPESDGQTERINMVLEDMLQHYVNPKRDNWDELLAPAEFAINNSYQASIKDTPFFLNYGRHPRMPTNFNAAKPSKIPDDHNYISNIEKAINKAKLCMQQAQERQKRYADMDRAGVPDYQVGQLAWLSSRHIALNAVGTRKLLPRWLGPFTITARNSPVNFSLDIPAHYNIHDNFRVSMLRRAYNNGSGTWRPAPSVIAGQEEWVVETLLAHKPPSKKRGDTGIQ